MDLDLDDLLNHPLKARDLNPLSVSEVFHKDPEEVTEEELQLVISRLRDDRRTWHQSNAKAKAGGKRTPPSAGVKLEDLDLDLDSMVGLSPKGGPDVL